jgi:fatty acid desaturase
LERINQNSPPPDEASSEHLVAKATNGTSPHLQAGSVDSISRANKYAELKRIVKQAGLLERQPLYYATKMALTLGLLVVSIVLVFALDSFWAQMANAAYLAFVFVQISLVAHDWGHRQFSFRAAYKNRLVTLMLGNLLLGISQQWWIDKHNDHHANPNHMDHDPDVDIPLLAFEEEQAMDKRGIARFVVKYQAAMIFPLSLLQSLSMSRSSVQFLLGKKAKSTLFEALLMVAHFGLYFGLLFTVLPALEAALFVVVHRGLFGMYMVSIFAPNHKAMPTLEEGSELDFLGRQVLTSRNVRANPMTDFMYGGLNYQIEHHLFPSLPRNNLKRLKPIVVDFCKKHEIGYHETSVLQSYREILEHLHEVGAPLRQEDKKCKKKYKKDARV